MAVAAAYIGKIVKTVGLKGEIKLLPGPDFWQDALDDSSLELVSSEGERHTVRVERYRAKGGTFILKLSGVDSIDAAEDLVGRWLEIDLEGRDASGIPSDHLPCRLLGLEVRLSDGSCLGRVVDLLLGKQQNCLIVKKGDDRYLVPDVPPLVRRLDIENGFIEIDPPEGLLSLRW